VDRTERSGGVFVYGKVGWIPDLAETPAPASSTGIAPGIAQ
jgi:hypothetical protein